MSPHPLTQELVELPGGLKLELSLTCPSVYPSQALPTSEGKLAICLHPWSWLGGQMDDPVLRAVEDVLLELGFYVIRYNSRGVGRSSGWPSFTGTTEGQDLRLLVEWALTQIPNIKSVVIFGYSYGSLISSLFPIPPGTYQDLSHSPIVPPRTSIMVDRILREVLHLDAECSTTRSPSKHSSDIQ
ncbi:hypothetical protein QCA50_005543 [Cerrena zonata]|uniref:Xaa-Pro dipeptidyl-peptidase-like domain-containing protein n=1 Tax=Cerrena zonata TaxID=2478898 RepID=A0AAW0GMQ8_9APHY